MKSITSLCLLLSLNVVYTFGQTKIDSIDHYFSKLHQNQQFNGNVLIADHGKIIYQKSFGYADFATERLNTKESTFPIASITKTVTSTAVLQLKDKGKLNINDLITKYLPNFPYKTITIRNLLSQTSGLPIYDDLFFPLTVNHPDTVFNNKDIMQRLIKAKLPLVFQPNEDYSYNNLNYNILALIVEKISGLSFKAYLQKNIFNPAGMSNTSLSKFFSRSDKKLSLGYGFKHNYNGKMERPDTTAESHGTKGMYRFNFEGHGDLISNTADLLKYDKALYNGTLLKASTLTEAFTTAKLSNGKESPYGYGLGWISLKDPVVGDMVRHDGGLPGFRSELLRNITRHQTVILFDNASNNVIPLAYNAMKILNGVHVPAPKISGSKIYGVALAESSAMEASKVLAKLKEETNIYYLDENELNDLGYEFMGNNKAENALAIFKLNTELFPANWNVYDSYGEILLKEGKKEEAIKMYQKSVELNPANENGKNILKEIVK